MDDLNIKKLSEIKAEMFGMDGGDGGRQAKPIKSKPIKKKKHKKHQRPAPVPSMVTRLSELSPSRLKELDSKYGGILDNDGKIKVQPKDNKGNRKINSKKSKGKSRYARARDPLVSFYKKPSDKTPSTLRVRTTHRPSARPDKEYTVQWDNVTFEDRYLVIRGVVPRKKIDLFYKPAQASFNFIKRRIANRLQPFKIQVTSDQARLIAGIYLGEVIEYMECQDALEQMLNSGLPDYRGYYDRIPSPLPVLFFPKDKKHYLDILCDLQADNRKIIPVAEVIGDTLEDAFLFTVEREGVIYIVWENTNLSRATYVFRVDHRQYDQRLQFIFDYIVSNVRAKRQRLHSESIGKELFGDFEIINHTEIGTWRLRLDNILSLF